jgi:hypothetical protein
MLPAILEARSPDGGRIQLLPTYITPMVAGGFMGTSRLNNAATEPVRATHSRSYDRPLFPKFEFARNKHLSSTLQS